MKVEKEKKTGNEYKEWEGHVWGDGTEGERTNLNQETWVNDSAFYQSARFQTFRDSHQALEKDGSYYPLGEHSAVEAHMNEPRVTMRINKHVDRTGSPFTRWITETPPSVKSGVRGDNVERGAERERRGVGNLVVEVADAVTPRGDGNRAVGDGRRAPGVEGDGTRALVEAV